MRMWWQESWVQNLARTIALVKTRRDWWGSSSFAQRYSLWEVGEIEAMLFQKGHGNWLMVVVINSDLRHPIRYWSTTSEAAVMRLFTEIR